MSNEISHGTFTPQVPIWRPALALTGVLLIVCTLIYPAAITAVAQTAFKHQAEGSLIERSGKVVGSSLMGQSAFDWAAHPEYLWGRPSAASNDGVTGVTVSSGSNYGPTNGALVDEVKARVDLLRSTGVAGPIPIDLVTKSASGVDPHLSPAGAEIQVARIAATRKIEAQRVRSIIASHTKERMIGLLGERVVDVLGVNLELDASAPYAAPPPAPSASASH